MVLRQDQTVVHKELTRSRSNTHEVKIRRLTMGRQYLPRVVLVGFYAEHLFPAKHPHPSHQQLLSPFTCRLRGYVGGLIMEIQLIIWVTGMTSRRVTPWYLHTRSVPLDLANKSGSGVLKREITATVSLISFDLSWKKYWTSANSGGLHSLLLPNFVP